MKDKNGKEIKVGSKMTNSDRSQTGVVSSVDTQVRLTLKDNTVIIFGKDYLSANYSAWSVK